MAKSNLLERAEITEVYYPFGKFYQDQRNKFVKAPFDLVKIGTEEYVMPLAVGGNASELSGAFNNDNFRTEQYMGRRDFGFPNLSPTIVGEHEMGGSDRSTWKGVHSFDFI